MESRPCRGYLNTGEWTGAAPKTKWAIGTVIVVQLLLFKSSIQSADLWLPNKATSEAINRQKSRSFRFYSIAASLFGVTRKKNVQKRTRCQMGPGNETSIEVPSVGARRVDPQNHEEPLAESPFRSLL